MLVWRCYSLDGVNYTRGNCIHTRNRHVNCFCSIDWA